MSIVFYNHYIYFLVLNYFKKIIKLINKFNKIEIHFLK